MRNTDFMIDKPIAQSVLGVSAVYPLVAFRGIHGKKGISQQYNIFLCAVRGRKRVAILYFFS
jgi:hypothetical protein